MSIFNSICGQKNRRKDPYIMYGNDDWMDSGYTPKKIKNEKHNIKVYFIQNCNHLIEAQNMWKVYKSILKYYK